MGIFSFRKKDIDLYYKYAYYFLRVRCQGGTGAAPDFLIRSAIMLNEKNMMEFSFSLEMNVSPEAVWRYYENLDLWPVWEEDLEEISLDGGFKTGSRGVMKLAGMPPLSYVLSSVIPRREFWDETETPLGRICFGHVIEEGRTGSVLVRHTVRLESPAATKESVCFLQKIFSDVPGSLLLLKKAAENEPLSIQG